MLSVNLKNQSVLSSILEKQPLHRIMGLFILPLVCCSLFTSLLVSEEWLEKASSGFSQPFIAAVKKTRPCVALIKVRRTDAALAVWEQMEGYQVSGVSQTEQTPSSVFGLGSGFLISSDGYILTNNHVLEDAENTTVLLFNGEEYAAKMIGVDPSTDIALIKIDANNLPFLTFADSSTVEVGEWVIAVGSPFGLNTSVTTGVVSAEGRALQGGMLIQEFFQTDAAINPGNSGGPLVNLDGDVIGMNTMIVTTSGGSIGLGFSIPSNLLKTVSKDLREQKKLVRGYLGALLHQVDEGFAAFLGLDKSYGVYVEGVAPNSPAERIGLKKGDVILELQGSIIRDLGSFRTAIALSKPSQEISLKVHRDRQKISFSAIVAELPRLSTQALQLEKTLGIHFQPIVLDQQYSTDPKSGLLVYEIEREGVAYTSGCRAGDIFLYANKHPLASVEDLVNEFTATKVGGKLTLKYKDTTGIHSFSLVR